MLHIVIEEVLRAFNWREEDAEAAEADGSGPRIAVVVQSDKQRQAVQHYFSQDDEAVADDDKKMQAITKRIAAIGKLLHFIVQEKTLVRGRDDTASAVSRACIRGARVRYVLM